MATPQEQAMQGLQAEMQNTRAQLALVGQRFDTLASAHTALQTARDALRSETDRVLQRRADEIKNLEQSVESEAE